MTKLSDLICEACSKNATLLPQHEIDSLLQEVIGWELIVDSGIQKLTREFQTKNYAQSISYCNAVAALAESVNHHPQIIMEYSSVTINWWSHNIKGLHKNDFIMAAKTTDILCHS